MKFPRPLQFLVLCSSLTSIEANASPSTTVVASQPTQFTDAQAKVATDAVMRRLKDPESARAGRAWTSILHYADGRQNLAVCGLVNARNSFGGYTGDQFYLVLLSPDSSMATAIFDAELVCRAYGIIP